MTLPGQAPFRLHSANFHFLNLKRFTVPPFYGKGVLCCLCNFPTFLFFNISPFLSSSMIYSNDLVSVLFHFYEKINFEK